MFEILVVYQNYKKKKYIIKQQKVYNKIEIKRKEFVKQNLCWRQKYVPSFLARNERHVSPMYLVNHILRIRALLSLFCPPPYQNLFGTLIYGITSLLSVRLHPFHPFNFIIQWFLALHGLLNGSIIQCYTTFGYLHILTIFCKNNYCYNNVANIIMVFALLVLQFLPCYFKILTNHLTLP